MMPEQLHCFSEDERHCFSVLACSQLFMCVECIDWHNAVFAPRDGIAPFDQYVPVPAYSFDERDSVLCLRQEACPDGLDDVDVIFKVESKKDFNSAH